MSSAGPRGSWRESDAVERLACPPILKLDATFRGRRARPRFLRINIFYDRCSTSTRRAVVQRIGVVTASRDHERASATGASRNHTYPRVISFYLGTRAQWASCRWMTFYL